ncbi:MAG: hypothetical protein WC943_07930, partial [Elusimicrobiota bacterium]
MTTRLFLTSLLAAGLAVIPSPASSETSTAPGQDKKKVSGAADAVTQPAPPPSQKEILQMIEFARTAAGSAGIPQEQVQLLDGFEKMIKSGTMDPNAVMKAMASGPLDPLKMMTPSEGQPGAPLPGMDLPAMPQAPGPGQAAQTMPGTGGPVSGVGTPPGPDDVLARP